MRVGRAGVLHAAVKARNSNASDNSSKNKKRSRIIEMNDFHAVH